jgi:hypothetical protein
MDRLRRACEGVGVSLAVLAAAAALAGCGSSRTHATASSKATAPTASTVSAQPPSPTQSSPGGAALTRAQLVASAGAICKLVNAELTAVKAKSASVAEIVRLVPGRALSERKAVTELSKLTPPASLAHDWQLIVGYRRTLADELTALAQAAQSKDTVKIKALSASKLRAHALLLAAAKRAGLTECGRVG